MCFGGQIDEENMVYTHRTKYHSSINIVKSLMGMENSVLRESNSGTNTTCSHLPMKTFKSELAEEENGVIVPRLGRAVGKCKKEVRLQVPKTVKQELRYL